MAAARIYQPAKTAMQSGRGKAKKWILDFDPATRREPDPLMGWQSSGDTLNQVRLTFDTKEDAITYAEKKGWPYTVSDPQERTLKPKAYADNFATVRRFSWTH